MSTISSPANMTEAMQGLRAIAGYLAAADATEMAPGEQAQCLRAVELIQALGTAARAWTLAAFIAAQGHHEDACYGPKSWLINQLGITKAAATAYLAWARRAGAHPRVLSALAATEISESVARTICAWQPAPRRLPGHGRRHPGRGRTVRGQPGRPGPAGRRDLRPVQAAGPRRARRRVR